MKRAVLLFAFALAAFSLPFALGQQSPQDAPHAPDGGTRERISNVYIPPLPNAPFTATVTAEWTRNLDGGGAITTSNHRSVARDSSGRIFQERRHLVSGGDRNSSPISELDFSDPNLHELYICIPSIRTCRLHRYDAPVEFNLALPGELPGQHGSLSREDLGKNTLEGVEVVGTRETLTINPNTMGNSQPLAVTKEFWYSPQLGINLLVKRVDPRHGTQIFSVSELKLASPPSATFQLPQGYAIQDLRTQSGQEPGTGSAAPHKP